MGTHHLFPSLTRYSLTHFCSEIKFGALFDNLPEGTDFLATG